MHLTLENPEHSLLATIISWVILFTIMTSTLTFVLDSYAELEGDPTLEFVNTTAVLIFSVEYALRFIFHQGSSRVSFIFSLFNMIDLLAILPWYLNHSPLGGHIDAFRVLRVLRLFRLLRRSNDLKMFITCIARSLDSFKLLGIMGGFAVLIFSSLMWYAERGTLDEASGLMLRSDGSESPFSTIPATFWWAIVTMTTVGYGDTYPVEPAGKMVATVAMILGILVLALPLSIVGTNFSSVYEERQLEIAEKEALKDSDGNSAAALLAAAKECVAALSAAEAALGRAAAMYSGKTDLAPSLCKAQILNQQRDIKLNLQAAIAELRSKEFAQALME